MTHDELPDDPEIDALLAALDEPPPPVSVEALIARGRAPTRAPGRRLRWAAGIALAFGVAGAAYAAPGSPVATWLDRVGRSIGLGTEGAPSAAAPERDSAGVALDASAPVVIRFEGRLSGHARISWTDGSEVVTRSADASTRFTSEPERLLIEHPSLDTLEIRVPRTSTRVEIRIGAQPMWVKQGPDVVTSARPVEGGWILTLDPGSR